MLIKIGQKKSQRDLVSPLLLSKAARNNTEKNKQKRKLHF